MKIESKENGKIIDINKSIMSCESVEECRCSLLLIDKEMTAGDMAICHIIPADDIDCSEASSQLDKDSGIVAMSEEIAKRWNAYGETKNNDQASNDELMVKIRGVYLLLSDIKHWTVGYDRLEVTFKDEGSFSFSTNNSDDARELANLILVAFKCDPQSPYPIVVRCDGYDLEVAHSNHSENNKTLFTPEEALSLTFSDGWRLPTKDEINEVRCVRNDKNSAFILPLIPNGRDTRYWLTDNHKGENITNTLTLNDHGSIIEKDGDVTANIRLVRVLEDTIEDHPIVIDGGNDTSIEIAPENYIEGEYKHFSFKEAKAIKFDDGWRLPTKKELHMLRWYLDVEEKEGLNFPMSSVDKEGEPCGYYLSSSRGAKKNTVWMMSINHKGTDLTVRNGVCGSIRLVRTIQD